MLRDHSSAKDLFIKNRSKYSSYLLLYLLRFFMNKSLEWTICFILTLKFAQARCGQAVIQNVFIAKMGVEEATALW